ncbi:hypothetical protein BC830DRAFT_1089720 [Chytriomyces sp. MP71]|nr:hypothetical protein BC830DRAFT_1089720 [Chytriomyces sp. MP71]
MNLRYGKAKKRKKRMFKKGVNIKSTTTLRGSDQKKLRAEVEAQYGACAGLSNGQPVTKHVIDEYFGTLFVTGGNPLFARIDLGLDRRTVLVPTLYTLFAGLANVRKVATHGGVARRLLGGADLMLPGVIRPVDAAIRKGDIVAIEVNGVPVAVAASLMDAGEMVASGMRGRGFQVIHCIGDALFAMGDGIVPALGQGVAAFGGKDGEDEEDDDVDEQTNVTDAVGISGGFVMVDATEGSVDEFALVDASDAPAAAELEELSLYDSESIVKVPPSVSQEFSPQEMDALLEQGLLTAIKLSLPQDAKSFPMPATSIYSLYMLPINAQMDVKQSSHKKLSKFLKAMEKKGYLKLKERQGGELVLVSVNRTHHDIMAFVVDKSVAKAKNKVASNIPVADETAPDQTIQILDLFKATGSFIRLWKEVGFEKDALFTRSELKQATEAYIKAKDLVNAENPRLIKIDAFLADTILQKDEYATVDFLARDAIFNRICEKMTPMHSITAPGHDTVVRKGTLKPLSILVEKRQGRKTVTRILNVEAYFIDPDQLANDLRIPCAASTAANAIQGGGAQSGKPVVHEVLVQGNKVHEVCVFLRDRCGFVFGTGAAAAAAAKGMKLGVKGGLQCQYVEVIDKS